MLKVQVLNEGKQFEAYLKFAIIDENELVGIAYANNFTSCRAVHAALYGMNDVEIVMEKHWSIEN